MREPNSLRFAEYADRLRRLGQLADAVSICERGLERHPSYSTGHVVMGEILSDSGEGEQAEAEWHRALKLDPGHPRAHVRLGELYLSRGDTGRAITAFEAALLSSPDLPEARAGLAEAKGPEPDPRTVKAETLQDRLRTPGERPEWLSADRFHDLVQSLAACPSLEAAALADDAGAAVAGELPRALSTGAGEAAVSFLGDARALLSRLGAGRLRSALICCDTFSLRCVPLGDLALVAALGPNVPIHQADLHIEAALAALERGEREDEDADE